MSTVQTWTPRRSRVSIAMLIGPLALLWMVTSPAQGRTETSSSGGDFHATVLNSSMVFPGSSYVVSESLLGRTYTESNPCRSLCRALFPSCTAFFEANPRPFSTAVETEPFGFNSTIEDGTGEVLRGQDCCPAWTLWSAGYGGGGRVQGAGIFAPGMDYSLGGVQLGMNRVVEDEYLVGVYGNFGHSSFTRSELGQSADVDSAGVGIVGCLYDDRGHTFVNAAYGYHDYSTQHDIVPLVVTALADYHSHLGAVYAERGWNASVLGFRFQPYAGLQYVQLHSSEFTDTLGLTVAGVDHGSLGSVLGIRTGWTHTTSRGWTIQPIVHAAWFHEFLETQVTVNTGPIPVAMNGLNFGRERAVLGAGIELEGWRGTRVYFNYDLQVNTYHAIHVGSGGLAFQW